MTELDRLVQVLEGRRVRLQTHDFPDPDAIASVFGLQYLLQQRGISAELCYCGRIDKISTKLMLQLLQIPMQQVDSMEQLAEEDVVITVDGQKDNSNFTDIVGEEVACIDHHPWVTPYSYSYVLHRLTGACATIVTGMFLEEKISIPESIATALLYGIKIDTQNFCNGVSEEDIQAFALLHPLVNQACIAQLENNSIGVADLRAYGAAIQNVVIYEKVGFAHIPFDCPDGLIAMVSGFLLSLDAIEVSVVYAERNGGYKFSIRSEMNKVNAGKLVNLALYGIGNGGGHPTMAGGVIYPERVQQLGELVDVPIRQRFLETLSMIAKE